MDLYCPWEPAKFLFFSENIPSLLYYSHFTGVVISLLLGTFVILSSKKDVRAVLLFIFFLLFSAWAIIDVAIWATNQLDVVMFWWSMVTLIEPLLYVTGSYLVYAFIYNKFPPFRFNLFWFIFFALLLVLTPTYLTLEAINLYDCVVFEGPIAAYYTYFIEILAISTTLYLGISNYFLEKNNHSKRLNFLFSTGIFLFLIIFASGNIIGSLTYNWELAQYGLFGLPIFAALLTYTIVELKAFNIKLIGAQALVIILWALVGSLLFVAKSETTKIVAGVTLVFTTFAGYLLIRSVKKEVKQREELELLTQALEKANDRLKELDKAKSEFVSIASHQLRSPLTAIRGYASMLAEGSFGQMPAKAQESAKRIEESAKLMAISIEDYLNVSRIESGNMKYNLSDFNLLEMANHLCDDLRPEAMGRNLILLFRSNVTGKGIVNADVGKTNQIIHNLINNSIKYTPKGSVSVFVHDDPNAKKIYIDIIDTGIGMSKETIDKLFGKFSRASNANSVNTSGTGLGLYVALKMAQHMGGNITCTSEGDGKGSTFTFELPMVM